MLPCTKALDRGTSTPLAKPRHARLGLFLGREGRSDKPRCARLGLWCGAAFLFRGSGLQWG